MRIPPDTIQCTKVLFHTLIKKKKSVLSFSYSQSTELFVMKEAPFDQHYHYHTNHLHLYFLCFLICHDTITRMYRVLFFLDWYKCNLHLFYYMSPSKTSSFKISKYKQRQAVSKISRSSLSQWSWWLEAFHLKLLFGMHGSPGMWFNRAPCYYLLTLYCTLSDETHSHKVLRGTFEESSFLS